MTTNRIPLPSGYYMEKRQGGYALFSPDGKSIVTGISWINASQFAAAMNQDTSPIFDITKIDPAELEKALAVSSWSNQVISVKTPAPTQSAVEVAHKWQEYCDECGGTPDGDDYLCTLIETYGAHQKREGVRLGLEASAETNLDKTGRDYVPNSLWENMAKQFRDSILLLSPDEIANGK